MKEIKTKIEELYTEALKHLPKINKSNDLLGVVEDKINQTVANKNQIEDVNKKALELANDYIVKNGNNEELKVFLKEMMRKYSDKFITR